MNSKLVGVVIFIVFCTLQFDLGYGLKCYRCDSVSACKKPKQYECNQVYANETTRFLDAYYINVNTNLTSSSFLCMKQELKLTTGNVAYKGCVYSNMNSCGYTLRPHFQQSSSVYNCNQCSNKDGCNPADRTSVSMMAMLLPLVSVLIYKKFV